MTSSLKYASCLQADFFPKRKIYFDFFGFVLLGLVTKW